MQTNANLISTIIHQAIVLVHASIDYIQEVSSPNVYVYHMYNRITRVLCNVYSIVISHYFVSD